MELIPRHGIAVKEIKRRKSLARMVKQRASWCLFLSASYQREHGPAVYLSSTQ